VRSTPGQQAQATTNTEQSFFDIPPEAVQWVFNLNFIAHLLPIRSSAS
jgi:hypothetical protein